MRYIFYFFFVYCEVCKKEFKTKLFWLKKGWGKFCSSACQYKARRKGKVIPCHICGKERYKTQKQLKGSKSGLFFCGKNCQTKWRNQVFVGAKHANWIDGAHAYRSVLGRNKVKEVCTLCETRDKRILAVHHLDRDHKNNEVANLAWLCHNCHFLVHHDTKEGARFLRRFKKQRA